MRRLVIAVVFLGALFVPLVGLAADTITFRILNTANVEDPVEDVARTFVFEGASDANEYLFVKYRAPGGAPCASTFDSDSGSTFSINGYSGNAVNGAFRFVEAYTWLDSGAVMFCMWIAPDSDQVTTPFSRTVTFREPTGSVAFTVKPAGLRRNQTGTFTVSGASEAPRTLYLKMRSAGGPPCAPSRDSDSGSTFPVNGYSGNEVNGAFSFTETVKFTASGSYLICAWLREDSDSADGLTPFSFRLTIPKPPPPCVVPRLRGKTVTAAVKALRKANCVAGKRLYRPSRRVRRGRVLGTSPPVGTRRYNGYLVKLIVSTG